MTSDHGEMATRLFDQGYNCSQAVFSVYAEECGLDPVVARKIATSLGAGIGRTGNICGAVSGAILAIGLLHGMNNHDDSAGKEKSYALDQRFIQEFTNRYGSIECPVLLGFHLGIPQQREEAQKEGAVKKICPGIIIGSTEILDEIRKEKC